MNSLPRRDMLRLGITAAAMGQVPVRANSGRPADVHQELLIWRHVRRRSAGAVRRREDEGRVGGRSRSRSARLSSGSSTASRAAGRPAAVTKTGRIEADDYLIEKLVFESFPGYFVSALLYKPKKVAGPLPASSAPAATPPIGKAADAYQILHINLAKRGYVVLTYDPVGQGERSQFWDAEKEPSRFNLACGEHAVLGNPLYLLGSSLARYPHLGRHARPRLPGLAAGGGPDEDRLRRQLRRRHADRLHRGARPARRGGRDLLLHHDAAAAHGQPHPGRPGRRPRARHLRLRQRGDRSRRPARPVRCPGRRCSASARLDFFPIEGARESFAEAKRLYEVAGAGDRIARRRRPRSTA